MKIIMPAVELRKKLSLPRESEWLSVDVPEVDTKLYDGAHIYFPQHTVKIAPRYPTFKDGGLAADMTQSGTAQFLRDYSEGGPVLFEDEAARDQLGKRHVIFDENFMRNNSPWRWGYILDFNKPYGNGAKGIGQMLVTRVIGYRLRDGDVELGVVTIAPSGIVPTLSRKKLEKRIGAEGLKLLAKLRGKDIYEKGDEIVDVRNALGYPQFTMGHDAGDEDGLVPHSHYVYTPGQNEPERVSVRDAALNHLDVLRCFDVALDAFADRSNPFRSVPLVRGGIFGAKLSAVKEYRAEFPAD